MTIISSSITLINKYFKKHFYPLIGTPNPPQNVDVISSPVKKSIYFNEMQRY